VFFALSQSLFAQAPGTISGRIIDPNKNPLTGFTGATQGEW